ncbi:MAG TPA: hypothetical protein VIC84_16455 [Blastocatellia bacterium]|jgi:hypothetical protein
MLIIAFLANGEAWNEKRNVGAAFYIPRLPRSLISATQVDEIIAAQIGVDLIAAIAALET